MGWRTVGRYSFGLLFVAATLTGPAAYAGTPEALFAADASGMVKVNVRCSGEPQSGSGFLLGPRLMMTARHVLVDELTGKSCVATVVQDGTNKTAKVVRWTAIRVAHSKAPTDLALAVLSTPLKGYDFSISAASPKPGQLILALGYGLGQPLSLNQGHVAKLVTNNKVRLIQMKVLEMGGASGGPVLDAKGRVVGINQFGGGGIFRSVDLAHLVHDDPSQLCFGVAIGQISTVCGAGEPKSSLLEQDVPPQVCGGLYTVTLPFQTCPADAGETSGVVELVSRCSGGAAHVGSGFLLGPRLVMTARAEMINPKTGASCTTVAEGAIGKPVAVTRWMGIQLASQRAPTDVAVAVLRSAVRGDYFSLSPTSPKLGQAVHVLDYAFATANSQHKNRVVKLTTMQNVPVFQVNANVEYGDDGSPIVNLKNQVVGIVQWGDGTSEALAVNLALLDQGDPTQFCFSDARGQSSTICPAGKHAAPTLLARDGPSKVCSGSAVIPPFSSCPTMTPTFAGCWVATADSYDKSAAVSKVSDALPTLYFLQLLGQLPASDVTGTLTLTSPTGVTDTIASNATFKSTTAGPYRTGPTRWSAFGATSVIEDGTWTFTSTLSDGQTCSASVTAGA